MHQLARACARANEARCLAQQPSIEAPGTARGTMAAIRSTRELPARSHPAEKGLSANVWLIASTHGADPRVPVFDPATAQHAHAARQLACLRRRSGAYNGADPMPLTAGTTLGPYEILSLIGAGGMGEVYRATDTRLDRMSLLRCCRTASPTTQISRPVRARGQDDLHARSPAHLCAATTWARPTAPPFSSCSTSKARRWRTRLARGPLPLDQALRRRADRGRAGHAHRAGHRAPRPQARQRDADAERRASCSTSASRSRAG